MNEDLLSFLLDPVSDACCSKAWGSCEQSTLHLLSFVYSPFRKYYRVEGQKAQPMVYMNFETPLARGAVRLGVFRIIEQEADDLPDLLFQGTNEIGRTFPAGEP